MKPANKKPSIMVVGDAHTALFHLPPGSLPFDAVTAMEAHTQAVPVGAEYIFRAIRAACCPVAVKGGLTKMADSDDVLIHRSSGDQPFTQGSKKMPLYQLENVDVLLDHDGKTKLPLLRFTQHEAQILNITGLAKTPSAVGEDKPLESPDVLVHWFGDLAENRTPPDGWKPSRCRFHIQIGLARGLGNGLAPHQMAAPTVARIIVVNIGELCDAHRVRRSLSYEAIAVDLLRHLRGDSAIQKPEKLLEHLSMKDDDMAPLTLLVVRLNNSAVFVYARKKGDSPEVGAWLLCHQDHCAPISQPELGQMVGYTGAVSAHLAATLSACSHIESGNVEEILPEIWRSLKRSLVWQHIAHERGHFYLLRKRTGEAHNVKWESTGSNPKERTEPSCYDHMFDDIVRTLEKRYLGGVTDDFVQNGKLESTPLRDRISRFDKKFDKVVLAIKVDIARAVANRSQWFMARPEGNDSAGPPDKFRKVAIDWLVAGTDGRTHVPGKSLDIPIVRIGNAELTDRREIEDYLAIHQALRVYALSPQEKIPLNLAVFGAPGSGKSYGVKQVVKHMNDTYKGVFKKEPMTFNLSQFKSLDDLPAALHLVRNECLSSEMPIVFFDEFDSSFNGQPFGWLKYFLAPMQDGEFYHDGQTFKMGRAVFVFAGGVNRSFEELNGRVRNPSFCEAKGPDFISRLKAHLNVQGINEPEEEADQGRYILRRGILLRGLVRQKLAISKDIKDAPLLH